MEKPLFIVFEGVDGSGKTTQIDLLKSRFKDTGLKVMDTNEPSDGPMGMMARNIMKGRIQADHATLAALFLADRLDHIQNPVNGLKQRLAEGYNIICSRYYFSNYAFQCEYVPIDWLVSSNAICKTTLKPDLIFYLSVDPETCFNRITKGRVDIEIFENREKIAKTHRAFLNAFAKFGSDENIHIVDGNRDVENISNDIWKIVENRLQVVKV